MPHTLHIPLHGPKPPTPFTHSRGLHRTVLDWFNVAHVGLGRPLHDPNCPKPLTISPLWTTKEGSFFTISLIEDLLLEPLVDGIIRGRHCLKLGEQTYHLRHPNICSSMHWSEFLNLRPAHTFEIRVLSPTAHHAAGDFRRAIVLPTPALYFGSWLNRWNRSGGPLIDDSILQVISHNMVVSACDGMTEEVKHIGGTRHIGFVGKVRFELLEHESIDEVQKCQLAALSRFARYCGTGVETMRGMGQTCLIG